MSKQRTSGQKYTCRQTMRGGMDVLASIHLHCEPSPRIVVFWNATETTKPNMIPNAVHICHIMVRAPRMVFGADSAAYTGVVDDFAPTAKPNAKRDIRRLTQLREVSNRPLRVSVFANITYLLAAAIQIPVMKEIIHEIKMVPRRPK